MLNAAQARAACGAAHRQQLPIQQYAARACAPRRPARAVAAALARAAAPSAAARRPSTGAAAAVETAAAAAPQLSSSSSSSQQQQLLSLAVSAAPASALLALALALAAASPAEAAEHGANAAAAAAAHAASPTPLYSLSEGEDFFANVARYGRYFVTVMLGTGYMMVKPVVGLVKKGPLTAVLALGGGAAAVYVVKFTLDAMLGLSDPVVYDPDAVVSQALIRMAQ